MYAAHGPVQCFQLLLEPVRNQDSDQHAQGQHSEGDENDHRIHGDVEGRVEEPKHDEYQQEDNERGRKLAFQVGESEEEPLAEVRKRQEKGEVEKHTVHHVLGGLLHVGICSCLVAPGCSRVRIEGRVLFRGQRLLGQVDLLPRQCMQLVNSLVDNSVFPQPGNAELVQVPHVFCDLERRVCDRGAFAQQVACTLRVFLGRVDKDKPSRGWARSHGDLETCLGHRKDYRNILHVGYLPLGHGQRVTEHAGPPVSIAVENVDSGKSTQSLGVNQVEY